MNPRDPIYDTTVPRATWQRRAVWASGVAAVITLVVTVFVLATGSKHAQATIYSLAALWAIGAPLWFFLEYYYIYRVAAAPESWELFKHGQQVAIAFWAGVTAVLYALGSSDLAKPPKKEHECTLTLPASGMASPGTPMAVILKCDPKP